MSEKDFENQKNPAEDKQDKKAKGKKIDIGKAIQALEDRLTATQDKLEETTNELAGTKDQFQRTLAEYDNFRKRSTKEKSDSYANGKITAVMSLLPTLDVLEIALTTPCKDEEYKKGIEMVMSTAKSSLASLGVQQIETVGAPFDPNLHSAVMQETIEGTESGIITKELQKGYKLDDKVIRASTVAVAN